MRKITFTIALLFSLFLVHGHDFRIAHYTIHRIDSTIFCDVRIDLDDFKNAAGAHLHQGKLKRFMKKYLMFTFNDDSIAISQVAHEVTDEWIKIRKTLDTDIINPGKVDVYNDLLIGKVEDHDNVIRFLFHDRTWVFRLNEKRHQISFSY